MRISWLQKRALKKVLKKAKKKQEERLEMKKINHEEMVKVVWNLCKIFDVENEDGSTMTKTDLEMMDDDKIMQLFAEMLDELKTIV